MSTGFPFLSWLSRFHRLVQLLFTLTSVNLQRRCWLGSLNVPFSLLLSTLKWECHCLLTATDPKEQCVQIHVYFNVCLPCEPVTVTLLTALTVTQSLKLNGIQSSNVKIKSLFKKCKYCCKHLLNRNKKCF